MIPVLGCPIISRPDLLRRMLASVDEEVERTIIIDNGDVVPVHINAIRLPANLGVAASWNLVIKLTADAPWWLLVNADVEFTPGDLRRITDAMADPEPMVVTMDGFAAFAINAATVERVGFFDENYHPAYVEDCDYERRCLLANVPIVELPHGMRHDTSSTIADDHYAAQNALTYADNRRYHLQKWGGDIRGGETYDSPFDTGADPQEWWLDLARLRRNAWTT